MLNLGVLNANAQQFTVTGTISDEFGETLSGVTVAVKGTNTGVVSGVDGKYSITVPGRDAVLVFSYVGCNPQEVTVGSQTVINVQLKSSIELDEVVVTALGITKQARGLGYAMSTIQAGELVKAGSPNFATALYGKASGVRINAAPGGQTSAVSVTVRGISSIFGNTQPLLVMDGVPVRNGNANIDQPGRKNGWRDGRIEGNGLIDINPEDIESLSILKGAAASALYGSEAANGVIIVTTKKGATDSNVKVDFNASLTANMVAYMPKVQTEYGPGNIKTQWGEYEMQSGGFYQRTWDKWGTSVPQTFKSTVSRNSGMGGNQLYFGPKYDGSEVLYWDGTMRKYEAITDSPWSDMFRTGFNQNYNVGVSRGSDKSNFRFSYTYVDDSPTQYNSDYAKHNFSLNGGLDIHKNLRLDYTANYVRQNVHNRARENYDFASSWGGITGSFSDIKYMREHGTMTSLGYRYDTYGAASLTPSESFAFEPNERQIMEALLYDMEARNRYEVNQRLIGSVAPSWKIIDGLTLRGRLSTDVTAEKVEQKDNTVRPIALYPNNPEGGYGIMNRNYEIYYGDIMLLFDKHLTEKLNLTANAGWQGKQEIVRGTRTKTRDGLSVDNWFHLNASRNSNLEAEMEYMDLLRTAYLGSVGLSYDNTYYLEVTGRQEQTSTLPRGNNSYFYPSVNASYIFSEQIKDKLPWYDYGKLRLSYGVVGNAPAAYAANVVYNPGTRDGYLYSTIPGDYGNNDLKPERKYEFEIGLESRFAKNRLGFELSYYNNRVVDQLIKYNVPPTSGVNTVWQNMGELSNYGVELSLHGTPVETRDFTWDLNFNYAFNRNEITKLPGVLPYLDNGNPLGNVSNSISVRSYVGRPMGEVYTFKVKEVNGKKVLSNSSYVINTGDDNYVYQGNLLPDAVGGLSSSLKYKDFSLDLMMDYCIGGLVLNTWRSFSTMMGQSEASLQYRDLEHGGTAYYFEGSNTQLSNIREGTNPNGPTFYDGVKLSGLVADPSGSIRDEQGNTYSETTKVVPAGDYYLDLYGHWDNGDYSEFLYENTYLKMREIALNYRLPGKIVSKFGCNNLTLSLFGRNLFYLYKNLPDMDAESGIGTNWTSSGNVGASTAATRSVGFSLRASF